MEVRAPRIVLNGREEELAHVPATTTLLDWLREHQRLTGTKEGCAEGDCGACTVVLEDFNGDRVRRRAINACIATVGQVDGFGVRTVEGLAREGVLHSVQQAFAAGGSTQCGFCTPGLIMSAYAHAAEGGTSELSSIHDALAGNLCRCTGYRPIWVAIKEALSGPAQIDDLEEIQLRSELRKLENPISVSFRESTCEFHAPKTLEEALELRQRYPDAQLLAGGTDVGLAIGQRRERLGRVIYLGNIDDLKVCSESTTEIIIGAAATYESATDVLIGSFPNLKTYISRLGSKQIRNLGTIGGNIGTASPIGDFLPILLALSARIRVSSLTGSRDIDADSYFLDYRKTALAPDELIEAIIIPKPRRDSYFFADKISKRRDQDISTVCSAFLLVLSDGKINHARLAFGGMASVPKRAELAEAVLLGKNVNEEAFAAAGETLAQEFQPITDWRGSREYRLAVAKNLMLRASARLVDPGSFVEMDRL